MRKNVIALGFFDGVHLGHRRILRSARELAESTGCRPIAVTFDDQPRAVLTGEPPRLLTTRAMREEYIRAEGIDEVVMLHFDRSVASTPPEDFVRDILINKYDCAAVVCGDNYTFGAKGTGDGELLKRLGAELGFESLVCDPVIRDGRTVSSTWIRELIVAGDVLGAAELLGRPYRIRGVIEHGRGVGRKMGFPTGNIPLAPELLPPRFGVYAARISIDGGDEHTCALNIGVRPTFGPSEPLCEFNIIDFSGDIYGRRIELSLVDFIRDERVFESGEALSHQIECDIRRIKELTV